MLTIKHMKIQLLAMFISVSLTSTAPFASDLPIEECDFQTINVVTGEVNTTYYQMAEQMGAVLKANGLPMKVHPSNGSGENMRRLHVSCLAQAAIVQVDALAYLTGSGDKELAKMAGNFRYLFPLHNEEVHILAGRVVKSFKDLHKRRVAVGAHGSGTFMTATVMMNLAGIKVIEEQYTGKEALAALKKGEIDAMFYVAGFPLSLFEDNVTEEDALHFLPIVEKRIHEWYPVLTEIPASAYNFMSAPVNTVSVRSALITWAYKKSYCPKIAEMGKLVKSNIDYLRANGHSKWQDVDLSKEIPGWQKFVCDRPYEEVEVLEVVDEDSTFKNKLRDNFLKIQLN